MENVADYFGCLVFDDKLMKERLDGKIYQKLRKRRESIAFRNTPRILR